MRNIIKIESNERVIENNHLSNLKYLSTNVYHLYALVRETSVLYEESTQKSVIRMRPSIKVDMMIVVRVVWCSKLHEQCDRPAIIVYGCHSRKESLSFWQCSFSSFVHYKLTERFFGVRIVQFDHSRHFVLTLAKLFILTWKELLHTFCRQFMDNIILIWKVFSVFHAHT